MVNGLALVCLTCYRYAPVKMNCFSDFDKAAHFDTFLATFLYQASPLSLRARRAAE
jgi:hypothetical protein